MGMYAVARGEVVAEPATVTTDAGTATVLVVRDCGAASGVADPSGADQARGPHAGGPWADWLTLDCGVEYEVTCRRVGLARRVGRPAGRRPCGGGRLGAPGSGGRPGGGSDLDGPDQS